MRNFRSMTADFLLKSFLTKKFSHNIIKSRKIERFFMKIKRFIFLGAIMLIFAVFFAACDCSSLTAEKIDPSLKLELKDNVYHVTEITDKSITKIELPLTYRGKPVSVYEKNIFF